MLTRRRLLGTAGAVATSPLISLPAFAQAPKDAIVIGMSISDMITLDPGESFEISGSEVTNNIYDRLVRPDPTDPSKISGVVAQSWTVADNKVFTFTLRPGFKFSSGKPLTAEDAAFSLHRASIMGKTPAFIINQFGFNKDNVEKLIRANGPDTLVIELPNATSPSFFLNCLSANVGSVVEKAAALANAKDGDFGNAWLKQNSAGSGPYMLRTWRPSDSVVLEENPNALNKPKTRRVIVRHMPEPAPQALGLEKGDVDVARGLSADLIEKLKGDSNYKVISSPRASTLVLGMSQKFAPWQKNDVRLAVKNAIDYEGIAKNVLKSTYVVQQMHQPIGFPGAITDKPYSRKVDEARALMKAAGFENGFEVAFDYSNAYPINDIAQALQANLADIGIKLKMLPAESRQALTKFRARNSELYMGAWAGDFFDPHTNTEWFLYNPDNTDNSKNRTFAWRISWDPGDLGKEVIPATKESDGAKRLKMYEDLQRAEVKVTPTVHMFQQVNIAVTKTNVTGVSMGLLYDATRYDGIVKT